jgi:hypothetical protein
MEQYLCPQRKGGFAGAGARPALTNYWAGCILPRHGGASRGGFGQRNRAADDPSFGNRSLYRLDRMACGLHVTTP